MGAIRKNHFTYPNEPVCAICGKTIYGDYVESDGVKTCPQCAGLNKRCPVCGRVRTSSSRYCLECGSFANWDLVFDPVPDDDISALPYYYLLDVEKKEREQYEKDTRERGERERQRIEREKLLASQNAIGSLLIGIMVVFLFTGLPKVALLILLIFIGYVIYCACQNQ